MPKHYYGYNSCKPIKNTLKLLTIKKMICKNMIIIYKYSPPIIKKEKNSSTAQCVSRCVNDKQNIEKIKREILESKIIIPLLLTISINGIFNIIQEEHIKFILAIKNISYKEIRKFHIENINIQLLTFPYINRKEIFNSFIYK